MAKSIEKIKARELRRQGFSIKDIAKTLGISKGSSSLWCEDIVLNTEQTNKLREKVIRMGLNGRMKGAEMNRKKRIDSIKLARQESEKMLCKISDRDLFILGLGLYWAEGSKNRSSRLCFTNSDPKMIKIIMKFFEKVFSVEKSRIIPRVAINESHRERENKVLLFWSEVIEIPISQFRKTSFVKSKLKKIYENHNTYFGTMTIRIEKSSGIWYKILTSIDILKESLPA